MSIASFIKGKLKQREMRKLKPEEDFEFDKIYYGDTNIIDGFNFIYCNNYTDKFTKCNKQLLSYISCVISVPAEIKAFIDLGNFMDGYIESKENLFSIDYRDIYIHISTDKIQLFLRGNIDFYNNLCENIHNNIFTKYIRNNLFLNDLSIETPNEFLNNMYNSINNPFKELDILFIEDKILCDKLNPVIGLSMNEKVYDKFIGKEEPFTFIIYNNRYIIYTQIDKLSDEQIDYLVSNVEHGDKLFKLLHDNNDYSDIDEIIEE